MKNSTKEAKPPGPAAQLPRPKAPRPWRLRLLCTVFHFSKGHSEAWSAFLYVGNRAHLGVLYLTRRFIPGVRCLCHPVLIKSPMRMIKKERPRRKLVDKKAARSAAFLSLRPAVRLPSRDGRVGGSETIDQYPSSSKNHFLKTHVFLSSKFYVLYPTCPLY